MASQAETAARRGWRPELWHILAAALALRILFAWITPLSVDEAYEIAVARAFSWSFFDHPPLGFWGAVAIAKLTGVDHVLAYRLPALVLGMGTTALIFGIGQQLGGRAAGLWAAGLQAASPGFALAGVAALPDAPLSFGMALAVFWLVRIVRAGEGATTGQWAMAGLGLAIALASKYQAGLVPISVLAFALANTNGRRWFLRPGVYVGGLIGLVGLAPVVLWNMSSGWASFAFQSGRTGDGLQPANFAVMLAGQAVYMLPPVAWLALRGLWFALRGGRSDARLVAFVALGPILAFNLVYLFSAKSFPHWALPGWLFALPLAGVLLAEAAPASRARALRWLGWFAGIAWAALLALAVHFDTGWLTRYAAQPPAWDHTIDVFDYSALGPKLEEAGYLDGIDLIAGANWIRAGQMSTALKGQWPVRVLQGTPHHFAYLAGQQMKGTALLLDPETLPLARKREKRMLRLARELDPHAVALPPLVLNRGGVPYVAVNAIRLRVGE